MTIKETYEAYKHLAGCIEDKIWIDAQNPGWMSQLLYIFWSAIKEEATKDETLYTDLEGK